MDLGWRFGETFDVEASVEGDAWLKAQVQRWDVMSEVSGGILGCGSEDCERKTGACKLRKGALGPLQVRGKMKGC